MEREGERAEETNAAFKVLNAFTTQETSPNQMAQKRLMSSPKEPDGRGDPPGSPA